MKQQTNDYDHEKAMCSKKRKYKSSEASKQAHKYGQRKYRCPYCKGWHLTKDKDRDGI